MKILALELSTARGSLAWLNDAVDLVVLEWTNDRKNSGAFFENLAQIREQFGVPDTIIVGLGPGSYAGTRIAISAAIGLQAASKARLLGLPSICAIENRDYCVIGDARRQSFFFARIRNQELIEGPSLFSEAALQSKLDALRRTCQSFVPTRSRNFRLRLSVMLPQNSWHDLLTIQIAVSNCLRSNRFICGSRTLHCQKLKESCHDHSNLSMLDGN